MTTTNTKNNNNNSSNKINQKEYLESFKEHLLSLAKSQNTADSYLSDLKQYFGKYDEINRGNVQRYKSEIAGMATATFNRKLSSLKQFNEYLVSKGLVDEVVIYKADYTKVQDQGNPTNISEKTVLRFLDRVNKKECMYKSRNMAIIYLMANTGIRRSECCNMLLSSINLKEYEMGFIGKGNKFRKVALNKKVVDILNEYLKDRANMKYADSEYLFVSEKGEKLNEKSINRIFEFYWTPTIKVTCHQLRHNFLTTMLENGKYSIVEAQNQAGHSHISTTMRYLHPRLESMKQKIRDFSIG